MLPRSLEDSRCLGLPKSPDKGGDEGVVGHFVGSQDRFRIPNEVVPSASLDSINCILHSHIGGRWLCTFASAEARNFNTILAIAQRSRPGGAVGVFAIEYAGIVDRRRKGLLQNRESPPAEQV